jgi:hypothetical protein
MALRGTAPRVGHLLLQAGWPLLLPLLLLRQPFLLLHLLLRLAEASASWLLCPLTAPVRPSRWRW